MPVFRNKVRANMYIDLDGGKYYVDVDGHLEVSELDAVTLRQIKREFTEVQGVKPKGPPEPPKPEEPVILGGAAEFLAALQNDPAIADAVASRRSPAARRSYAASLGFKFTDAELEAVLPPPPVRAKVEPVVAPVVEVPEVHADKVTDEIPVPAPEVTEPPHPSRTPVEVEQPELALAPAPVKVITAAKVTHVAVHVPEKAPPAKAHKPEHKPEPKVEHKPGKGKKK